jgi:xylulokinase
MLLTGGGARSAFWRQMFADVYGLPVRRLANDEGAALGAALLAGVGAGIYEDLGKAAQRVVVPGLGARTEPDAVVGAAYAPFFALYKELYRALSGSFGRLAAL